MSATAVPRCSDAAREREDPLAGTAAPARRWLLIEHPGPWAVDAFAGSGIDVRVREALQAAAGAATARILLVRRPGRPPAPPAARTWGVLDHSPLVGAVWGTWSRDTDLLAAVPALHRDGLAEVDAPDNDPVLLVCAHGRHDTCCAVRGRPVAAELQRHWPEQTWECSHVGGDRFAANLVVLPDGVVYGNLAPLSAVGAVRGHLREQVPAAYLRGMSTEPPVVQAAVVAAHARWGPAGARDVTGLGLQALGNGRWQVELSGSGPVPPRVVAVVQRSRRDPALLTCRASVATAADSYAVVDLRPA